MNLKMVLFFVIISSMMPCNKTFCINDDSAQKKTMSSVFMESLNDKVLFFKKFIQKFKTVGAIAPSSSYLADAMSAEIAKVTTPLVLLEVGAGLGDFTAKIVAAMKPNDVLYVVELEQEFHEALVKRFGSNPNIHFFCGDINDFKPTEAHQKFDFIISGLPFNAGDPFTPSLVDRILKKYESIIKPGGTIRYFEYALLPTLKTWALSIVGKQANFLEVRNTLKTFQEAHNGHRQFIGLNLPPAYAITCQG
jgi:phospholipid N-methyltransferase